MSYDDFELLFDDFDMAYEWFIGVFYSLIDFLNSHPFLVFSLIVVFAVPSVIYIIDFILYISSDSTDFSFNLFRKKSIDKNNFSKLNKYQKAYLRSLKFDKKNNIDK